MKKLVFFVTVSFVIAACNKEYHHDLTFEINGLEILRIDKVPFTYNDTVFLGGNQIDTIIVVDTFYLDTINRTKAVYLFRQFDFQDNPQRINYDFENTEAYFLETELLKTTDGKVVAWWRREMAERNRFNTRAFYGEYYVIVRIFDYENSWLGIRRISVDKSSSKKVYRFDFYETDKQNVFLE